LSEVNGDFLTAKQFADIKGKHGSWGARLAKQAHEAGYQHLKKMGNYWIATYEEWEQALEYVGIQLRNRESYRKEDG